MLAALTVAGCELVLGELPPAKQHGGDAGDGSSSGGGGSSSSSVGPMTATASSGSCCDCDGDGHAAIGPCGGDDCDDGDKRVYPGELVYHDTPSPTVGFDWDCSGVADRKPELLVTVECGAVPPCPTTVGYLAAPPPCGESAAWGTCVKQMTVMCVQNVIEQAKKMACK